MEIREADVEGGYWESQGRVPTPEGGRKIQFHLREMNLKSYIAE